MGITLVGLLLLLGTLKIPFGINAVVGPRVFPMIVSVGTLALGALLIVNALRGDRDAVLPALAANVEAFLKVSPSTFADVEQPLGAHVIGEEHLAARRRPEPELLGGAGLVGGDGALVGEEHRCGQGAGLQLLGQA